MRKRNLDAYSMVTDFDDAWIAAGNVVQGPANIRDPMTTVVVPPGRRNELDEYLVLHYR